jgi:hypothetical protein
MMPASLIHGRLIGSALAAAALVAAATGQFDPPFVWRKNVTDVVKGSVLVFWGLKKS